MSQLKKPRDYLFDNYKVLLIFLVVVGHFVGPSTGSNGFLRVLKWFIVSFHMPAFVFISGYFAKKEMPFRTMVQRLAIPYVICQILYCLLYSVVLHQNTNWSFFRPKFTLWYLMALFLWRIVTPYVKKIPHYMLWSVLAGLLIGFSNMPNNFLTIPRALVFYPFYLAGTSFERQTLTKMRSKKGKWAAAGCIGVILVLLTAISLTKAAPMQIFYGRYNYASMKQGMVEGVLWRIVAYVIGFAMTFAVMILMPEKELPCSWIGTRTMSVYLFHGLTYTWLNNSTSLLKGISSVGGTIGLLALCAGLTFLFSLKPFHVVTGAFSKVPLPSPEKTR